MTHITGIKTENDSRGHVKYLRIDLDKHGDNELLEDFLDNLVANERAGEDTTPYNVFSEAEYRRRGLKQIKDVYK